MDYRMLWRSRRIRPAGRGKGRLVHDRRRSALHECVTHERVRTLRRDRPLGLASRPFADRTRGADVRNMIDNPDPL
jgi:hypothetical protein